MDLYNMLIDVATSKENFNRFFSSGNDSLVLFSNLFSTNIRKADALISYIEKISEDLGIPRNQWRKNNKHGQEVSKQFVIPLLSAEYIYKGKNNIFFKSNKAEVLENLSHTGFSAFELNFVSTLFVANYKTLHKNALSNEYQNFVEILANYNYSKEDMITDIMQVLNSPKKKHKFMENKLFLYMVFYLSSPEDIGMMPILQKLTDREITDFYFKLEMELNSGKYLSPLAQRLKPGGNLTESTINNMFLLLIIYAMLEYDSNDYESVIDNVLGIKFHYQDFNTEKLKVKLTEESVVNVLAKVFEDINSNFNFTINYNVIDIEPGANTDITTHRSKTANLDVFNSLKNTVLENANHKCALESLRNCNNVYFTSKRTGKNYLEVHHYLPRKYSAFIEAGVEFLENYIPLCPSCHRMIHHATDNERKIILNYILNSNDVIASRLEKSEINNCKGNMEKIEVLYDFK